MKKEFNFILSFILAALIAVTALTGCNDNVQNGGEASVQSTNEEQNDNAVTSIGEGETVFQFEATDADGEVTSWNVSTDETLVGAALLEVGLISGDETEYGLYVKTVNGITADYDVDGAYWAFYVDGEYASSGVDTTEIEQGRAYAFVYTKD